MKEKVKIGFLSYYSPQDRKASSGTNFKMAEQLDKISDLKWIPIKYTKLGSIIQRIVRYWNRRFSRQIHISGTKIGAKVIYKPIKQSILEDFDLIVAFFCMPNLAFLKTTKPIIYFTDATYPRMIDYYKTFTNLFPFNKRQGIQLEKVAMDNASAIILSSNWAAESAIKELNQSIDKVNVIEFGANIDDKDIKLHSAKNVENDTLELLFVGVDWNRKGGDIAVQAAKFLNENGIQANLHITGITTIPNEYAKYKFIKKHGFLNKNNQDEYARLVELYKMADLLILPTKAECSAIVFAESSAHGLPIFTHDTGGVSNYVRNGVNGYLLPIGSTGEDFGRKIKDVVELGKLKELSYGCKQIYKEKLNWEVWGERVKQISDRLIKK